MMLFGTHWPHVSMCPVHVSTKWSVSLLFWAVKKQPRKRGQFKIRRTKVESYTLLGTITYPSQSYFWVDGFSFFSRFGGAHELVALEGFVTWCVYWVPSDSSQRLHPLKPCCLCWNDLWTKFKTRGQTWHLNKPGNPPVEGGWFRGSWNPIFLAEAFSTIRTVVGSWEWDFWKHQQYQTWYCWCLTAGWGW